MAAYMTQKTSAGVKPATLYYRKQTVPHPTHDESSAFTTAAKTAYAGANQIAVNLVELGAYMSGQNKPSSNNAVEV